eukprot:3750318-Lingulodinium_polyedra.AAC.1
MTARRPRVVRSSIVCVPSGTRQTERRRHRHNTQTQTQTQTLRNCTHIDGDTYATAYTDTRAHAQHTDSHTRKRAGADRKHAAT